MKKDSVALPQELHPIIEKLAEKIHESWFLAQLQKGWTYGPTRDDRMKNHPCLVIYADLSEEEKNRSRRTATAAVQGLLDSGFTLIPSGSQNSFSSGLETVQACREQGLLQRRQGDLLGAFETVEKGLGRFPDDTTLRRLKALVLADLGSFEPALRLLEQLTLQGHIDEETLGIKAGTQKKYALTLPDGRDRNRALKEAFDIYQDAFAKSEGYYSGINAAALALLLGKKRQANDLAGKVVSICRKLTKAPSRSSEEYFLKASLAEAFLLTGKIEQSLEMYKEVGQLGRSRGQDLFATRRHARLALSELGQPAEEFDRLLALPNVAVFVGSSFPASGHGDTHETIAVLEARLKTEIETLVRTRKLGFVVGSVFSLQDLIAMKIFSELVNEWQIVLPFNEQAMIEHRMMGPRESAGTAFFQKFLRTLPASRILKGSANPMSSQERSLWYANRLAAGVALFKIRQWETGGLEIVWRKDSSAHDRAVEDSAFVYTTIDLSHETVPSGAPSSPSGMISSPDNPEGQGIYAVLFADVARFGQLNEAEVARFIPLFFDLVANVARNREAAPLSINTWGDTLFAVFPDPLHAAQFARALAEAFRNHDWRKQEISQPLDVRVSLHAGPIQRFKDPISHSHTYAGAPATAGLLLDPVIPPGVIYCTQAFVAHANLQHGGNLSFEYVGRLELGRQQGIVAAFRLAD